MRAVNVVDQIERLEDQLQAMKWMVRPFPSAGRTRRPHAVSIVTQTAGLLRSRLPDGRAHQRRLRQEWERRFAREVQ